MEMTPDVQGILIIIVMIIVITGAFVMNSGLEGLFTEFKDWPLEDRRFEDRRFGHKERDKNEDKDLK